MNPALLAGVALIGVAIVALAIVRPTVALLFLVGFDVSHLNEVVAGQIGISLYKPELALALLVAGIVFVRSRFRVPWSPVLVGAGILLAGFCLSLLNAADPGATQALLIERVRDFLYFGIVYLLLTDRSSSVGNSVKPTAQVMVLVLSALAGITLVHEFVLHNNGDLFGLSRVPIVQEGGAYTARHAGPFPDVNFWARTLVLVSPLAYSLFAAATPKRREQVVWLGCAVSLLGGIYLTQSRGGFIALLVAIACWLIWAGGIYRKLLYVLPVVLLVLLPLSGIASRLGSVTGGDASVAERTRLQIDALRMFLDSPLVGHGIGSYGSIFAQYDRLTDNYQPVRIVVAAHNLYLEQAADGGIVLLLAWAIFIGSMFFVGLRARALAANDPTTRFLAAGVLAGLAGWLTASVFLHLSDFRTLLLVAAMAGALDVHARATASAGTRPTAARAASRRDPLAVGIVLVTAGVLGVGGSVYLLQQGAYQSTATLAVVPSATRADGASAYQLDVVSRGVIVPTIAAVLDGSISPAELAATAGRPVPPNLRVTVAPTLGGGAVLVSVAADTPADAADFGAAALTVAKKRATQIEPNYQLKGELTGVQATQTPIGWLLVVSLLLLSGGIALLIRRRMWRRTGVKSQAEPTPTAPNPQDKLKESSIPVS